MERAYHAQIVILENMAMVGTALVEAETIFVRPAEVFDGRCLVRYRKQRKYASKVFCEVRSSRAADRRRTYNISFRLDENG